MNPGTDVPRTVLVLAYAVVFSAAACTSGAPTSSGTPDSSPGTSQPATSAPTATAVPAATAAPKLGAWKRLANQPTFERAEINDVIEGGPGYIAIGCQRSARVINDERRCTAAAWTSQDGLRWNRSPQVAGARDAYMDAVTLGGPGFVAVGTQANYVSGGANLDGAMWTSTDGLQWSRVPFSEGFRNAAASDVVPFGAGLIAAGESYPGQEGGPAAVWSSANGLDWRREDTQEFQSFTGGALGVLGDRLVLSGSAQSICGGICRRQVWTSPDGSRWTRVPDSPAFDGAVRFHPAVEFRGRMLVTGFVGPAEYDEDQGPQTMASLWSTTDGSAWERITIPAPRRSSTGGIVVVGSMLVAVGTISTSRGDVGQAITWTSTDGRNWKLETVDPALRGAAIRHVLVTDQGLVGFGARQADGPSEHVGIWLRPFDRAGS